MFVRVLDVRTLLQVLWFGVLEVSRFKCQRISSGLVFQFEGLDQRFLQILFFLLLFCGFKVCPMFFFRFSLFVRVLGVNTLLQVLWFGVSEVIRFKCQRVSGFGFSV